MTSTLRGGSGTATRAPDCGSTRSITHTLGFRVEFLYGDPPSYAGVERDSVLVHLQAASDTKRIPGQSSVYVFVTDVDALYRELNGRGARVLAEPRDYPYGMRDFDVQDLDGNRLAFGMETARG